MPAKNNQEKIIEDLSKLAEDVVSSFGLSLVAIGILQQGKRRVLNITIHRKGSRVSLDDCENVSRRLEAVLDERAESDEGPVFEGAYVLDVESPGIDRVLKSESEYRIFEGETVEVRLKESIEGLPTNIKGTLVGLHQSSVTIKNPSPIEKAKSSKSKGKGHAEETSSAKEEVALPLSSVYSVRLYPDMNLSSQKETVI